MTKLLSLAVEKAQKLPDEVQDYLARVLLRIADVDEEPQRIDADERALILEGLKSAELEGWASDEQIEVAFRLFDR